MSESRKTKAMKKDLEKSHKIVAANLVIQKQERQIDELQVEAVALRARAEDAEREAAALRQRIQDRDARITSLSADALTQRVRADRLERRLRGALRHLHVAYNRLQQVEAVAKLLSQASELMSALSEPIRNTVDERRHRQPVLKEGQVLPFRRESAEEK